MTGSKKFIPTKPSGDIFSKRSLASRVIRWVLITSISLAVLLVLTGSILSYVVQNKAEEEFRKVNGTFSSLSINLFTRSVTVRNVNKGSGIDSSQTSATIKYIKLRGIRLFDLLVYKRIHAKELQIDSGSISIDQSQKKDTTKSPGSQKIFPFEIENIIIHNVFIELQQNSTTQIEALIDLQYGALKIDSISTIQSTVKSSFHHLIGNLSKIKIKKKNGLYTSQVDKIEFNSNDQSLFIDSLKLIPNYGKYEFAHVHEKQVSRLDLSVHNIGIMGLNYHKLFDSLISIQKIAIHGANLHSFRDKRVAFKNGYINMPMRSLEELEFALEIDSILIDSTKIIVEEFAEQAIRPGRISFLNLSATMTRLSNRYYENKPTYSQLDAKANIMGNGRISASFRFPLDGSPLYSAKGSVSNMPLTDLNPILENSAQIRIESGILNELYFNFNYTDYKSVGTIEINYNDLQLTKLNSDKEKSVDRLNTVLINAFLKKTKDETTEQRKRMGIIDQDRDRHRFVFNLWWKSIQSGLKSSVLGNDKK